MNSLRVNDIAISRFRDFAWTIDAQKQFWLQAVVLKTMLRPVRPGLDAELKVPVIPGYPPIVSNSGDPPCTCSEIFIFSEAGGFTIGAVWSVCISFSPKI